MRTLEFRASYNVTLLNFVDSLSRWDIFVSEYVQTYYKQEYGLTPKDESQLEKYAKLRKSLDWPTEIELFNWAYAGFPKHSQFSDLQPTLLYFEEKKSNNNLELKSELEHATQQLENVMSKTEEQFGKLKIAHTIKHFSDLFESPAHTGILPCYLTYSPVKNSSQGGANGEGVYTQVSLDLVPDAQVEVALEMITLEYMHKELNPGRLFENHPDESKQRIYNLRFTKIYPDIYYQFIEEVMVYTLNDVMTFNVNPQNRIDRYNTKYKDDDSRRLRFVSLWQSVSEVQKILVAFKEGKLNKQNTLLALDDYFMGLVG